MKSRNRCIFQLSRGSGCYSPTTTSPSSTGTPQLTSSPMTGSLEKYRPLADSPIRPFDEIPGPSGLHQLPYLGLLFQMKPFTKYSKHNMQQRVWSWTQNFGPICKQRLGREWYVFLTDPNDVEKVFRNDRKYPFRGALPLTKVYARRTRESPGLTALDRSCDCFSGQDSPPPPPPPPAGPRSPSPPSRTPPSASSSSSSFAIPTSDGNLLEATVAPVYTALTITVDVGSGKRLVREPERSLKRIPPPRPPPPRTPPTSAAGAPPPRPPPPQQRWMSPPRAVQDLPPPYQGIEVREVEQRARSPPPSYGEVLLTRNDNIVEMITRTRGIYPCIPPVPPAAAAAAAEGGEQAKPSAPPMEKRGTIRPHSESPFMRNQRPCYEDKDLEEVVDFLKFVERKKEELITPPSTPTPAARPEVPPPMITGRILSPGVMRPTPVRRRIPPSAALGAPPREDSEEEDMDQELPDLPCATPSSDVTVHSTVSSPCMYAGYSSDEEWESMDEMDEEYEYLDPYEDQGPWSSTPPPPYIPPRPRTPSPPSPPRTASSLVKWALEEHEGEEGRSRKIAEWKWCRR